MAERTFPLGRIEPSDDVHVQKYRMLLTALPAMRVPVILGINWYRRMFTPVRLSDGRWWLGVDEQGKILADLGPLDGGHAIAVRPQGVRDYESWHQYYIQPDGSCTGSSASRVMTWLNRVRYDAHWLYEQAQLRDEFAFTPPEEGSSVRATMDVLRDIGHRRVSRGKTYPEDTAHGVAANRWAVSVPEVHLVLQSPIWDTLGAVPLNNTWSPWPREVFMPDDLLHRLLSENGEATMLTDR